MSEEVNVNSHTEITLGIKGAALPCPSRVTESDSNEIKLEGIGMIMRSNKNCSTESPGEVKKAHKWTGK